MEQSLCVGCLLTEMYLQIMYSLGSSNLILWDYDIRGQSLRLAVCSWKFKQGKSELQNLPPRYVDIRELPKVPELKSSNEKP